MSQDVMICVMNSTAVFSDSENLEIKKSESCNKCLDLEDERVKKKNMVERDVYTEHSNKYFKNNDLKAQLQAKDTTIYKLKEHLKSMRENKKEEKVKQEMDENETINIELEHSVAKLLSKNELLHKEIEHLKKIYKDQFDLIKKTPALSEEHYHSLIAQFNSKSMENTDLKGQIQEKVFVTTALQNELRKLKAKNVLDNATIITNATTITPGMFKLDLDPLAPMLLKNRDAHIDYLKYTQKQANIIQGILKQAKGKQPLDNALDFVCMHAKRIQELLVYVRDTCPTANKSSEKLVAVTPMNKVKKVRIANNSKPNHSWESNATDVQSSSSLVNDRFGNNQIVRFPKQSDCKDYVMEDISWKVTDLKGSRDTNLYIISLNDMLKTSPICLLSKASKTKTMDNAPHEVRGYAHINFGTLKASQRRLARAFQSFKF
ncbi:hypothetical protein Tco_1440367 [Tanacetum coccineum]